MSIDQICTQVTEFEDVYFISKLSQKDAFYSVLGMYTSHINYLVFIRHSWTTPFRHQMRYL